MSLNIRSSAPSGSRPRSTSTDRRNPPMTTTTTIHSTNKRSSSEYARPGLKVLSTEQAPLRPASESSIFSSETQEPEPLTKLLRFDLPAPQSKGRPDKQVARRRSPEKSTSRGHYASESDNESLWNSSDTSNSTEATSVLSKDDTASYSETPQHVRPTVITQHPGISHAGPSRRHTEYTDDYVRDQGQVVQVHVRPKQQQPPSSVGSKAAITPRQPPMITQAPTTTQSSDQGTNGRDLAPYVQVISNHGTDNSMMMTELYNLRNEVITLREKESKANTELATVQQRLEQLQKEKDELKTEETKLQLEVDELEEGHDKQSRQLDKTKDKVDGLKKAMDKLEKDYNTKLERAKKDRALAIQKIHKDRDQTQERIEKEHAERIQLLDQERAQLSETIAGLEGKLKETEHYLSRHKELNDTLEKRCQALEKETQQHTDYKGQFEAKTINLERELNDNAAIKKAQDSSYVARIATLEISLEARELRVKNLEDDLAKSTTESAGLTAERDKLKVNLQEQMDKVEALRAEISTLEKAKAEAHEQMISLDDTRQKELGSKDAYIATVESENSSLKAQLETAKQEQETIVKEKEELEEAKKATQEEAATLSNDLEQLRKDTSESTSRIQQLEDECNNLKSENESLQESTNAQTQAASESEARAQELQDQNSGLEARNTDLQSKAADLEKQLKEVRKALAGAENQVNMLNRRIIDMQKKGRPKPKRDPKKAEKILAVRCPRDETNDISIVRRKNIHQVQSASTETASTTS